MVGATTSGRGTSVVMSSFLHQAGRGAERLERLERLVASLTAAHQGTDIGTQAREGEGGGEGEDAGKKPLWREGRNPRKEGREAGTRVRMGAEPRLHLLFCIVLQLP